MVNSVMLGRVENVLEWPEVLDHFGVDPELEEEVELGVDDHVGRRNEEGHRQIKRLERIAEELRGILGIPELRLLSCF